MLEKLTFDEAFEKYIKDQTVISIYSNTPLVLNERLEYINYYVCMDGLCLSNNYTYASMGAGCGGYDTTTYFIISPENKIIASYTIDN